MWTLSGHLQNIIALIQQIILFGLLYNFQYVISLLSVK